ncbi:uncharacterized protein F4822DRAFT_429050 [Hypoxylon trugodes]|uniref:uncharacterized protein n=1 Tax=Hypoxylon trugodes TaxID=326681 RepID=UPI00219E48C2|nr:uncharacterized protein F4822DRAFT_429050 [Hypoxylon trugodes]KAI1388423.1 hypothetical protein F4822DRAFT_429050 [Hypoxylon trugodes]
MCVEVWNIYRGCNHKTYQNTALCPVAKRCPPEADMTLDKTKFLPDNQPKIPPGLLQCKLKTATKPVASECPKCARQKQAARDGATSRSGSNQSTLRGQRLGSPSPEGEGVKRLRDSLIMLEDYRKPPFGPDGK